MTPEPTTSFENRIRQHFGYLFERYGFQLELIKANPLEDDGVAILASPTCLLRVSEHHADGEIEWARNAETVEWINAFDLHHFVHHELGLSGPITVAADHPDWMATQAATVERLIEAILAFFQPVGFNERRGELDLYTAERLAAYRRERAARKRG